MTERKAPLDAALDLFLYLPVGLAVTAAEEIPKLAAKGRTRVNTQLKMARVVGEFAVGRARQQLESRVAPPPAPRPSPAPRQSPPPPTTPSAPTPPAAERPSSGNGSISPPVPSAELAIPGYDSLSASQVVQRLAGLSREELSAVAAYEQAHRARRTILNRASQLQGG